MSERLYRLLVERARHFHLESGFDVERGRYDIALFHLEQAAQLAIKAYMLREIGSFPRVHSLHELIEASGNECLKRLADEQWYIVDILVDAYTGSRCSTRSYGEKEYRAAKRFVEEVLRCTGI